MKARNLHPWDVSVAEAREIQLRLRERIVREPPDDFEPRVIAGADVAFDRAREHAFAAIVLIELATLETVETATAVTSIRFPYVPGYLSFRELPALLAAWEQIETPPDGVLIDAHGYAHPRRMGLACHAGLLFDLPTVGCAKSVLCGEVGGPGERRGATAPIRDPDTGEEIGRALRTKDGVRPVYVSIGHRVDLDTAVELVLRLAPEGRYRFPETTRRADRLAAEVKAATG